MAVRVRPWLPRRGGIGVVLTLGAMVAAGCSHDWEQIYEENHGASVAGGGSTGGTGTSGTSGSAGAAASAGTAGAGTSGTAGFGGATGGAAGASAGTGAVGTSGSAGGAGTAGSAGGGVVDPYPCPDGLLANGDMESRLGNRLQDWIEVLQENGDGGVLGLSPAISAQGGIAMRLDTTGATISGGAYSYGVGNEAYVPVTVGETLSLTIVIRVDEIPGPQIPPRVQIVYYDNASARLSGSDGQPFDLPTGDTFVQDGPFTEAVPDGAAFAQVILTVGQGTLAYLDAACLTK